MWVLSSRLVQGENKGEKVMLFQAESSFCADKLIICFTLSEQRVSLSSLPDHLCFITRHLDDKGNLGVKVNLEMTQGFGFLSVTQAWKTQLVPVTQGRGSQAWGWSRTLFSKGWFASRLGGVTFKFVLLSIFKFHPDSPVCTSMDGITIQIHQI